MVNKTLSDKAKLMSELFEIDVDASLNSNTTSDMDRDSCHITPQNETFEERCKDAAVLMSQEPIPQELIHSELIPQETYDPTVPPIEEKLAEIARSISKEEWDKMPADLSSNLDHYLYGCPKEKEVNSIIEEQDINKNTKDNETEKKITDDIVKEEDKHSGTVSQDNPLNLSGKQLQIFKWIQDKYPRFSLSCNNPIYKTFYIFKLKALDVLLNRFPVLDLQSRRRELKSIKIDHFIGDDVPDPDLFRSKLDNCFRERIRLGELLVDAIEQEYSWQRHLELLQGKLYKDFDLRGAHKREGLNAEHIHDIEDYSIELKGFITMAKYIDGLLIAACDSLSRQLTCLQMRQPSVGKSEEFQKYKFQTETIKSEDPVLGDLDGIDEGEIIQAPKSSHSAVSLVNMGHVDPEDDLMSIGLKQRR